MITYSVAQVESLSGISAHSLRVWERRYGFIIPHRTDTNIRYYSDEQLKKLINVGILIRNNYKISKVAAMDDYKIHEIVSQILLESSGENNEDINALTISMIDMDESSFDKLYSSYVLKYGVVETFINLIYPFLHHVGVLWGINKTMPAQEHFISNLIRQKLISATEALPIPEEKSSKIVFYLFDGEDHEIGLLLANYIAKNLGWKTYYLGAHVPIDNISLVNDQVKPDLMFSMFVSPRNAKFVQSLKDFLETNKITLLYAGNEDLIKQTMHTKHTILLNSPGEFSDFLINFGK